MNCYIEVKKTENCIACNTVFQDKENAVPVRIQDNMGYSIALMCPSCLDAYSTYKKRKKHLIGV